MGSVRVANHPIEGYKPLGRVAKNDRLFGAPGMRILVLYFSARQQIASIYQGLDDGFVGIAPVPLVVDHAAARKPRSCLGKEALIVDGVRNRKIDAALGKFAMIRPPTRHPYIKVVTPVGRRCMDETRAGIGCDMTSVEKRHRKPVPGNSVCKRMHAGKPGKYICRSVA